LVYKQILGRKKTHSKSCDDKSGTEGPYRRKKEKKGGADGEAQDGMWTMRRVVVLKRSREKKGRCKNLSDQASKKKGARAAQTGRKKCLRRLSS